MTLRLRLCISLCAFVLAACGGATTASSTLSPEALSTLPDADLGVVNDSGVDKNAPAPPPPPARGAR